MNVTIKHGSTTYPLAIDLSGTGADLKEAIAQVTGVPIDRLKVMVKGILKNDAALSSLNIKPDQTITAIGSVDKVETAPRKPVQFLEDMAESGALQPFSGTSSGLVNLGQTCYLNSALQVLKTVDPLRNALETHQNGGDSATNALAQSVKTLFGQMQSSVQAPEPWALLLSLRRLSPQFAELDRNGHPAQQDADEAWTQIMSALRSAVTYTGSGRSVVDELFAIELTTTLSCMEATQETPTITKDTAFKLVCNISMQTNYLLSGILESLDQTVDKNSPSLGRSAAYKSETRVSRLPAYAVVQMVRFYWRRDIQKKAKIMRKVKFPLQLDLLDIVTPDLRAQLLPVNTMMRRVLKEREDRAKSLRGSKKDHETSSDERRKRSQEKADIQALASVAAGASTSDATDERLQSGLYELCGLITHKGPSADSGHYIGWVRGKGDGEDFAPASEQLWHKMDDEKVSPVTSEKVQSLDGGGEDSVAYILLYRCAEL